MAQGRNNPQSTFSNASATTLSLLAYAINTVINDRKVIIIAASHHELSTTAEVSGVTVGGVAATLLGRGQRGQTVVSLWALALGSDTAAVDIVATWDAASENRRIAAVVLTDTSQTLPSGAALAQGDANLTSPISLTATAPAGNSLGVLAASITTKDPAATETGQTIFVDQDAGSGNMTLSDRASTAAGSLTLGINRTNPSFNANKAGVLGIFAEDLGGAPTAGPPGALMMAGI